MKEKHLTYFKILDAFSTKECPLCFLINETVKKYFDDLLYEKVNDPGFRKRFCKDYGFCRFHSYKFLSYHDGLAVALTHRDLLIELIGALKKRKVKSQPVEKKECLICTLAKEAQERYISTFINFLAEEEFRNRFLLSEGFCVPHLKRVLNAAPFPLEWMINFHLKIYSCLLYTSDAADE